MLIIIAREEMYLLCKNTFKFYDKELVRGGQNMLSKVKRRLQKFWLYSTERGQYRGK